MMEYYRTGQSSLSTWFPHTPIQPPSTFCYQEEGLCERAVRIAGYCGPDTRLGAQNTQVSPVSATEGLYGDVTSTS